LKFLSGAARGQVEEVFGPVSDPLYTVRFPSAVDIDPNVFAVVYLC